MPKATPWVADPPTQTLDVHRRAGGRPSVLIQVWVPDTLRGQARELATELSERRGKSVSLSDVVRLGLRMAIDQHLDGA